MSRTPIVHHPVLPRDFLFDAWKKNHLLYKWKCAAVMLAIGRWNGSRKYFSVWPHHIVLPLKPRGLLVATAMQVFRWDIATKVGLGRRLLVITLFSFPSASRIFQLLLFISYYWRHCQSHHSYLILLSCVSWIYLSLLLNVLFWDSDRLCGLVVSSWLHIQKSRLRFPALPDFLIRSESETGSTQPREHNREATLKKQ
jgi:hypothetical protein